MTTHFRPPFPGLTYRRAAIAAAGAASVTAAITLGGYSLAHNIDYLHQGFAWTCASLPMADPGALADSFFGGASAKLSGIFTEMSCFSADITGAASDGISGMTQAARDYLAPKATAIGSGVQKGQEFVASTRASLSHGFSTLASSAGRQVSELLAMSPGELVNEAKQLAVHAMELFLAVKTINVGYKAATSWIRRRLRRNQALPAVAERISAAPAAAANVTINLTIAAGSSPEAANQLRDRIAERVSPSGSREQSGVEVIEAVMDAVEEAGTLTETLREQLEHARSVAVETAENALLGVEAAESLAGESLGCKNATENQFDVEIEL